MSTEPRTPPTRIVQEYPLLHGIELDALTYLIKRHPASVSMVELEDYLWGDHVDRRKALLTTMYRLRVHTDGSGGSWPDTWPNRLVPMLTPTDRRYRLSRPLTLVPASQEARP